MEGKTCGALLKKIGHRIPQQVREVAHNHITTLEVAPNQGFLPSRLDTFRVTACGDTPFRVIGL